MKHRNFLSFCAAASAIVLFTPLCRAALTTPPRISVAPGQGKVMVDGAHEDDAPSLDRAATYDIHWSDKPGVTPANGRTIAGIPSLPYVVAGLEDGTRYYFILVAHPKFAEGPSVPSQEVSTVPGLRP
jgi:hypothetical protein